MATHVCTHSARSGFFPFALPCHARCQRFPLTQLYHFAQMLPAMFIHLLVKGYLGHSHLSCECHSKHGMHVSNSMLLFPDKCVSMETTKYRQQ